MKKRLLSIAAFACFSFASFGQDTLFQDQFESGGANWTLNSGSGSNTWVINNAYTGYNPIINNTPNQPTGINGSPTSNYLHIHNLTVEMLGVFNSNFDTGSTTNQDATMTNSVSTVGKTNVTFNYWYLCGGAAGVSEGKTYYSTDNGATWILLATYSNVTTWTQATHTLPAFDNQATLKFKFNWVNGATGIDPAFSVDDVLLTASSTSVDEINDLALSNSDSWCEGTVKTMNVSFTAVGSFTAGNIFTAELSDASGNFGTPTSIGTLTSSTSGALTISATIPSSATAGNGYRIRVVSTNPSLISSTDNGTNLVINTQPVVSQTSFDEVCVYSSPITLTGGSPAGGLYTGASVSGGQFNPTTAGIGNWPIVYSYTDGNGCGGNISKNITVSACAGLEDVAVNPLTVYPNPATDKIYISGDGIKKIVIIDLLGNEVATFNKVQSSYDVQSLSSGAYFVKVVSENGTKTIKIQLK